MHDVPHTPKSPNQVESHGSIIRNGVVGVGHEGITTLHVFHHLYHTCAHATRVIRYVIRYGTIRYDACTNVYAYVQKTGQYVLVTKTTRLRCQNEHKDVKMSEWVMTGEHWYLTPPVERNEPVTVSFAPRGSALKKL